MTCCPPAVGCYTAPSGNLTSLAPRASEIGERSLLHKSRRIGSLVFPGACSGLRFRCSVCVRIHPHVPRAVKTLLTSITLGLAFLALTACGGTPSPGAPTATSAPPPVPTTGSSEPVSETYRLDLGSGVVVAFVEGLTPEIVGKVAYVTHVPTGSQVVLDTDGNVVDRHDGRGDGPNLLDSILDDAAMARILEGLTDDTDLSPQPHTISWVPMVKFGEVHYLRQWDLVGKLTHKEAQDLTAEDLGPEIYRVAFRGDGYAGPWYRYQDGDATFLNPGTRVYEVKGYSQEFRLATLKQGRVTLYEADTNPHAKTGGDLLDIGGKVTAIDILNDDEMTVLGTMVDETTIERFVDSVLEAPVDQRSRDHDGPRYFLGIRLADGTSVVGAFWLETGELSRGIMTDPVVTLSVWWRIPHEHLPAGTEGGPRISARLARRLGLAYLSFTVPELNVTGEPHSPTARLMLRSEFTAMRGGH